MNRQELQRAAQLTRVAAMGLDRAVRAGIQAGLLGMSSEAKLLEQARDKAESASVKLEEMLAALDS